jgi:hypothetical protein
MEIIIVGLLCLATIGLVYYTYTNNEKATNDLSNLQKDIAKIKKDASDLPIPQIQTMIIAIQNEMASLKSSTKTNSDINTMKSQILEIQTSIQAAINVASAFEDLSSNIKTELEKVNSKNLSLEQSINKSVVDLEQGMAAKYDLLEQSVLNKFNEILDKQNGLEQSLLAKQNELEQSLLAKQNELEQSNQQLDSRINQLVNDLIALNNNLADITSKLDNYGLDIADLKSAVAALQARPQQQTAQLMTTCLYTKGLTHNTLSTLMLNRRATIYGAQYLSGNPQNNAMWWDTYTIPNGYNGAWRFEVGGWRCGQGDGVTSMRVLRGSKIVYFQTRHTTFNDCNPFNTSYMWHAFQAGDQVSFRINENNGLIGNYNITNPGNQSWGNFQAMFIGPPVPELPVPTPNIVLIGLDTAGNLYRNSSDSEWTTFTRKFNYLTVGGDFIACLDSSGGIFHTPLVGTEVWTQIPGGLSHINAGYDTIVGTNGGGQIFFSVDKGNWSQIGGSLIYNAVDENRTIYGINSSLDMFSLPLAGRDGFTFVNNNPNRINRLWVRDGLLIGLNATGALFVSNIILGSQPNWVQIDSGVDYAATRGGYVFALKGGIIKYTNQPFADTINWIDAQTLPPSGFRMFDVALL